MKVKIDPLFIVAIVVHPFFLHCSEQFLVLMFCVDYKFLNDLFNSILLWRCMFFTLVVLFNVCSENTESHTCEGIRIP